MATLTHNPREFASKVREMRNAQKNFFKTRSPMYLNQSRELEKEVDAMLAAFLEPEPEKPAFEQKSMF